MRIGLRWRDCLGEVESGKNRETIIFGRPSFGVWFKDPPVGIRDTKSFFFTDRFNSRAPAPLDENFMERSSCIEKLKWVKRAFDGRWMA